MMQVLCYAVKIGFPEKKNGKVWRTHVRPIRSLFSTGPFRPAYDKLVQLLLAQFGRQSEVFPSLSSLVYHRFLFAYVLWVNETVTSLSMGAGGLYSEQTLFVHGAQIRFFFVLLLFVFLKELNKEHTLRYAFPLYALSENVCMTKLWQTRVWFKAVSFFSVSLFFQDFKCLSWCCRFEYGWHS